MKLFTLICRMDGTQELRETEVPDDWTAPDAAAAETASEPEKSE